MISCGDPSFGGALYGCTECGKLKFVPFRCKSRFCPSCGTMYSIDRTTAMSCKIINVNHRHCVLLLTMNFATSLPKTVLYSVYFLLLFKKLSWDCFIKIAKLSFFTPGFICVLHTFGRDLKWNPHIHCLVSEGGVGNSGKWRAKTHFNYTFLRNAFRTVLLNLMQQKLGPSFKGVKASCYRKHKHGFYVHAKPNKCKPKQTLKYIGRYLGRPVIATSRIIYYDGDFVTFKYNRHEDNMLVIEKLPVLDFIKRLIRHIPEKHFKMVRYYGIYASTVNRIKSFVRLFLNLNRLFIFL